MRLNRLSMSPSGRCTGRFRQGRKRQKGSSLIEVLVTLVILMLGLLGLVGLMVQSQRSQMESYQRVQALVLLEDMASRININRKAASCYAITTAADGTPFLGNDYASTPTCATGTAEQQARAIADMSAWHSLLLGSAEKSGTSNVGAMLGARGCVEAVAGFTGLYRVSVAWQGSSKTFAPPAEVVCAQNSYGDETQRRAVSINVQINSLN
jgi:type IV pilus assembly protein PilV